MSSLYLDFIKISHDYLVLLNSKLKRGEQNKTVAHEASTLEWYYNEIESLFNRFQDREQLHKLELFQERIKSKLLEQELERLMIASISRDEELINKAISGTNFDLKAIDFAKKVKYKKKENLTEDKFKSVKDKFNSGVKLNDILKHFILTKEQLIELIDGKPTK